MNKLRIGWASRDVSTDQPIDIPGQFHMRVSQGVLDPLRTTTTSAITKPVPTTSSICSSRLTRTTISPVR